MGERSQQERNKQSVTLFYEYHNNRDWDKLNKLFHENAYKNRVIDDSDGYRQRRIQNMQKFMRAIFDPVEREKWNERGKRRIKLVETDPKTFFLEMIVRGAELENVKRNITRMVADDNEVWTKERSTGIGYYEYSEYDVSVNVIFFFEDGKIIDIDDEADIFTFMLQLGGLKARTGNREDLVQYLDSLKDLGLIPDNVGITE